MFRLLPRRWTGTIFFLAAAASAAFAQSSLPPSPIPGKSLMPPNSGATPVDEAPPDNSSTNSLLALPRQLLRDQLGMWTSPARAKLSDATWLVPLGGAAAAFFATDRDASGHLDNSPSTLRRYRHLSDYGLYSMVGGGGSLYLLGLVTDNQHRRESGFLSGEAALDSLFAVETLKYATRRQRPYQGSGAGAFLSGGTSFPSEHSALAWSVAGILAHEYPSPFVKFLAYGAATAIGASRIRAQQHFPSDVLVGMAIGYLTSEHVYRQHHSPDLPGGSWETPAVHPERGSSWHSRNMGSPYVALDSWIYPAMDRLSALGYIHSGFADMRPWTRMECARQVQEAADHIAGNEEFDHQAADLFSRLQTEFSPEIGLLGGGNNAEIRVESAYSRSTEIGGKPLTDGDHFGQTIVNDYGRPQQQGFNMVAGMSGWAAAGPFAISARGEYQHSPNAAPLPSSAIQAIGYADFAHGVVYANYPLPPDTPTPTFDQGRLLDAYVAMNFSDWQLSYGNQSLWWGPSQGGPLMFSNNAEPLRMFRVNRVTPITLPGFLGFLGPIRMEGFFGQFSGYEFIQTPTALVGQYGQPLNPQPVIHGERISFKPTPNLEIGLSRTTDYGGPGYPLTLHTFSRSLFSTSNTGPGGATKPGSRRAGLDFSYRIPHLRNQMTFYAEGMAEHNEISPLLGPDVAAWLGGIYFPKLPRIPRLDFRLEGGYTDPPTSGGDIGYGAFYWDATWITGFQNDKHLMGSWMGRQGQGAQAWTTYWFSPRNKLQFGFRHQKVSRELLLSGGTLSDVNLRADFWPRSSFSISALVQYEQWTYPALASTRQSNFASSVQFTFWPASWRSKTPAPQ